MISYQGLVRTFLSAQARRGSKRALWGEGRGRHTSPKAVCRASTIAVHQARDGVIGLQNGAGGVWLGI
ncbi:hypothetical protein LGM24_16845 [Klebsiella quasipneumoniae subsp. quasipneumoniae]|uniref:hypothetical protein n=1 Tax=Klebsiella quasipneumoniae TaxID=1463165 RepID=UPI001CFD04AC|nr:hypothetical protein [Klebsiella quasipneumoniae]UDC53199.1 hypothetical protein LGM24_16845 [Klebsiella quasipneumoniae subsp. quasipneumoniae]